MKPEPPLASVDDAAPSWSISILRLILRLALIGVIVLGVHWVIVWLEGQTHTIGQPQFLSLAIMGLMLAAYALLIATPFVPGIEIGLALMFLQGDAVVPFVYLATVLGLFLAYLIGANLPHATLHRLFVDLRLRPACRMLERIAPLGPEERVALIADRLPARFGQVATRYRYVLLGIAINVPGNGVIGGGGGLSLMAGFSRLYAPSYTLLTYVIAVAPVPLFVWLYDRPVLPLPG